MQGDGGEADGREIDGGAGALDGGLGIPIIEHVIRQVDGHARGVLVDDGTHQHRVAEEELRVDAVGGRVGGVEEPERVEGRGAVDGLRVHGRVDVVEHAIADIDGGFGGDGHAVGPVVEFLRVLARFRVVPVEGAEGPQHGPAGAEVFRRVHRVPAYVRADHHDLVDPCKGDLFRDGDPVVVPGGGVVAEPVADVAAGAREGGARDDHGPQRGAAGEHGGAGGRGHHRAVEVVGVVFGVGGRAGVDEIRVDGFVGEGTGRVGDLVGGVEEVAVGQADGRDRRAFGRLEVRGESGQVDRRAGTDGWRNWGKSVGFGVTLGVIAGVCAEIGGFVHVDPEGVDVNTAVGAEEAVEFATPVGLRVGVEPVGERGDTGPYDSLVD